MGLTFLLAAAAFGYWVTTDSSHPAQAAAATLSAPTAGTQNGAATPTSIPIKWTAPSGYAPTGYTVLRCAGSSCTSFTSIGNGGCTGTVAGTSCTDTDPALSTGTTYSYEVQAQFHNWVSTPSTSFQAMTTAATKLAFTAQPGSNQSIKATGTGSFSVSVAIEDASGNVAANDNTDTVTLAIASGSPSGTLSCTGGLTAPASSGVASFTGCAITKAGSGYQLTASSATSPSLAAPGNANSFNITAGNASQVVATSGAGQSAAMGTAFTNPLVAAVEDANGNPVLASGVSVTFAAPSSGASATFTSSGCSSNPHTYSCVATTNANGQATSSAFTANGTLGNYTISASATGVTSASFPESNLATITSLVTANGSGGTAGQIDPNDTITITFSGQIDASKVCSAWTNGSTGTQSASTGSVVTVTNTGTSNNDLSFTTAPTACGTFNFGSIDLGSTRYVTSTMGAHNPVTFSNSTITYDGTAHTLTITLGTKGGTGTENVVQKSILTLTLSNNIKDTAENPLSSYTFPTANTQQF